MADLPKWELSHIGLFVTDMKRMRDFYTGLLGFKVMDSGELRSGVHLTFLSKDPRDHHQIVLVTGREKGSRRNDALIEQKSADVGDALGNVRRVHQYLKSG